MAKLLEYTGINKHVINLINSQQISYKLIYSLSFVELEILKIYIEINLANDFIMPSKSLAGTSILFIKKLNKNLQLYIDYKGLNNLTI